MNLDKLSASGLQKCVDTLKNTECSQKEKLSLFVQIADHLVAPSMQRHANHQRNLSSATGLLLMFCEETDSTTRMAAEEQLHRIVRANEHTAVVYIQYDLFHEIQKNGHQRSLRIAMSLFAFYMPQIKQRKVKPYAGNLLDAIFAIARRKETALLETLVEFVDGFAKHLAACLNEGDVLRLIGVFLNDTLVECSVKRRCAAQNICHLIEHSTGRRQSSIARHTFNAALDLLVKTTNQTATIGILSFLRTFLVPGAAWLLQHSADRRPDAPLQHRIIELHDVCLHLLCDPRSSHTLINAALEVIVVVGSADTVRQLHLKSLLTDAGGSAAHVDILRKRKSLKWQMLINRGPADRATTGPDAGTDDDGSVAASPARSIADKFKSDARSGTLQTESKPPSGFLSAVAPATSAVTTPRKISDAGDRSFGSSDIEMDSFRGVELMVDDGTSRHGTSMSLSFSASSTTTSVDELALQSTAEQRKSASRDSKSLRSQKSTESIGSFINTLLSHSNTASDSVTKFFRPSPLKSGSMPNTPKSHPNKDELVESFVRYPDDDDSLSMASLGSHMSSTSRLSGFSSLDMIDRSEAQPPNATQSPIDMSDPITVLEPAAAKDGDSLSSTQERSIPIGTALNQSLVQYTARLVISRFLLTGHAGQLVSNTSVRVSIKNQALLVVANCVRCDPSVLLLPIMKKSSVECDNSTLIEDVSADVVYAIIPTKDKPVATELCIVDDYFGNPDAVPLSAPICLHVDTDMLENECSQTHIDTHPKLIEPLLHMDQLDGADDFADFDQYMDDVLLYFADSDPMLRGNVLIIAESFVTSVLLLDVGNVNRFVSSHCETRRSSTLLSLNGLMEMVLESLADESHTVVKQALVAVNIIMPILLRRQSTATTDGSTQNHGRHLNHHRQLGHGPSSTMRQVCEQIIITTTTQSNEPPPIEVDAAVNERIQTSAGDAVQQRVVTDDCLDVDDDDAGITVARLLTQVQRVFANKYWVVQCKYCELIAGLNYDEIEWHVGEDGRHVIEQQLLGHLYHLLGDKDVRVRSAAASALCRYIGQRSTTRHWETNSDTPVDGHPTASSARLFKKFVSERVFHDLPAPLSHLLDGVTGAGLNDVAELDATLAKVVFHLVNAALELGDKHQQLGTLGALVELVRQYPATRHGRVYTEFNVLAICGSFVTQNFAVASDLSGQLDLMELCCNLMGGCEVPGKLSLIVEPILVHTVKMLNVFHHVITGTRPVFVPKGQKNDLFFSNSKEFAIFNAVGYFGNDYFYLHLYASLRASYNGYKIAINSDSGSTMLGLLRQCLLTMHVLLELKSPVATKDPLKLIDELLVYLKTLLLFAPKECVQTVQHLLRFMLARNYAIRFEDYSHIRRLVSHNHNPAEGFVKLNKLWTVFGGLRGEDRPIMMGSNIKLFEPMVIRCLKLFTKSNTAVQAAVLNMICEAVEHKVNYNLLDSNNLFLDFVLKQLELIETGRVVHSNLVVPSIFRFLFLLSRQRDQKLITIPKIINLCDNLLANQSIAQSGTLALNEMAFEFFFRTSEKESLLEMTPEEVLESKDVGTQREVAFSMLIKYLDAIEVQHIVGAILLLNKNQLLDNENEVLVNLLQLLAERKIDLTSSATYDSVSTLLNILTPVLTGDPANRDKILTIWHKSIFPSEPAPNDHQLALQILLLHHIIIPAGEEAALDHLRDHDRAYLDPAHHCQPSACAHLARCLHQITSDYAKHLRSEASDGLTPVADRFERVLLRLKEATASGDFGRTLDEWKISETDVGAAGMNGDGGGAASSSLRLLCGRIIGLVWRHPRIVRRFIDFAVGCGFDRRLVLESTWDTGMPECPTTRKTAIGDRMQEHVVRVMCAHVPHREWRREELRTLANHFMDITLRCADAELLKTMVLVDEDEKEAADDAGDIVRRKALHGLNRLMCSSDWRADVFADLLQHGWLVPDHNVLRLCGRWLEWRPHDAMAARLLADKMRQLIGLDGAEVRSLMGATDLQRVLDITTQTVPCNSECDSVAHVARELAQFYEGVSVPARVRYNYELPDKIVFDAKAKDERWFVDEATVITLHQTLPVDYIVGLLHQVKSEQALASILESPALNLSIVATCIQWSGAQMIDAFASDCVQFHPHINYLKMPSLLKHSLVALAAAFQQHSSSETLGVDFLNLTAAVQEQIKLLDSLNAVGLRYVDVKQLDAFVEKSLLDASLFETYIRFGVACLKRSLAQVLNTKAWTVGELGQMLQCADAILGHKYLWLELNRNGSQYGEVIEEMMGSVCGIVNGLETLPIQGRLFRKPAEEVDIKFRQAIQVGQFVMASRDSGWMEHGMFGLKKCLASIGVSLLRTDHWYPFAVTPSEILDEYEPDLTESGSTNRLPSIPIEYLNDGEVVGLFVKRINTFGFATRQHFEELFMSLLVLVNTENDSNMIDESEQHKIKHICLGALIELLLSCKMFPLVGRRSQRFVHAPRSIPIKASSISLRKLHTILQSMNTSSDVGHQSMFAQPNLERELSVDDAIGSTEFGAAQMEMNFHWQIIEEVDAGHTDVRLRNYRHWLDESGVDLRSSEHMIFDVFAQLIELNYVLVLPHLVKFCEICENREQLRWIRDTTMRLRDIVQPENAVSQQYIIYCMCKATAVLVPSPSELAQVCHSVQAYLKSSHLFVRIAALRGLLCLLESCVKTNTTIGGLSEETLLVRSTVAHYVGRHGIVEESDEHTKLVWTLTFYLIETTSKFCADCTILSNAIISANNLLKRSTNRQLFLCVIWGLQRLVVLSVGAETSPAYGVVTQNLREKIERIALDLVKLDNEEFSLPALQLLVTCMYIGSAEQLVNTELSNGIVQDEPEVIIQCTEKIDVLFQRIKTATPRAARIYGDVLGQIIKDLIPPNEILTKVIKELLTLSQPYCVVIAKIVFQVFRCAIDSTFLPLLQDWLICSMQNFLEQPPCKAVWSLSVIFMSASISPQLIKLFPELLAESPTCAVITERRLFLLRLVTRDFVDRISDEQRAKFRTAIRDSATGTLRTVLEEF